MIGRDVQSSGSIGKGIQFTPFEPTIREQRRIVRPTLGEAATRLLEERCARDGGGRMQVLYKQTGRWLRG